MSLSKITLSFISFFIILTFSATSVSPQIVKTTSSKYKPASVTVEFLANFAQPLPNLYGDVADFFKFDNYGVTWGFGSQINIKVAANKKGSVRPYMTIGYTLFLGSNDNTAFIDSNVTNVFPPPNNGEYTSTPGKSRIWLHDFYGGLGFEYAFVGKSIWTPYIGADFDLNVLFGTYRQTPIQSVTPTQGEISFTINSASRFGFNFCSGVQARLGKAAGICLAAKYRFANLLGKNSKVSQEVNKWDILDKSAPELHTGIAKDRQINYLEFGLGVVFFLGKK
jgi:hypothetical protein